MKPVLVSFVLCPFVQRSVITLLEKKVDFDISYIDLANPPGWFLEISPFGKVPALRVDGETIFESAVINEYLDEVNPPSMHPADPLKRAVNRAWIEFASDMIGALYRYYTADSEDTFHQSLGALKHRVAQLESRLDNGPFFNGEPFCLIDAAFAPLFTRIALLASMVNNHVYKDAPKVARWAEQLSSRDSVIRSVVPDFAEKYRDRVASADTYAASVFRRARKKPGKRRDALTSTTGHR